ncbi:MAG: 2,3-bisphosphoglycerate-independent phosphoglycerate mutase [Nanoarchaeota archaeon]|mgnify:CR=1 FL=1
MPKVRQMRPLLLIILDGWGHRKSGRCNALSLARLPVFDRLDRLASKTLLKASGRDVGLPVGFQGNSEVGHLNIGAGRVVDQIMVRLDGMVKDGSLMRNKALRAAIRNCKKNDSSLHVMGLVQDEGVHAHSRHAVAILEAAIKSNVKRVYLHFFTDGRDTPPKSAKIYARWLLSQVRKLDPSGRIIISGSLVGRYFALDRDKRWDRTRRAFDLLVSAKGIPEKDPLSAINHAYRQKQSDEFITPRVFPGFNGILKKDSVVFFDFRPDRARQITHAFNDLKFRPFKRRGRCIKPGFGPADIVYVAMTRYYKELSCPVILEHAKIKDDLGECLSNDGLKQLRVAETEKYAHVTYFFNSEVEKPFRGEDRILVPSPKVATYDLKPEMSALKITRVVLDAVAKNKYDVIIMNFANGDMVGHTGKMPAIIKAVQTVDRCVGKLVGAVESVGGALVITADHGNCEDKIGKTATSHTLNPVPFYLVLPGGKRVRLRKGRLADVAPTVLKVLNLPVPGRMSGKPLF